MTNPSRVSRSASPFDAFLFAEVREDSAGVTLSVVSALARSDLDPWQEAASLSRLPGTRAVARLAALIAALPGDPSDHANAGATATRLVALLPAPASPVTRAPSTGGPTDSQTIVCIVSAVILMGLALSSQFVIANRQPPPQIGTGQKTPAEGAGAPPTSTPSGQR